MSLRSQKYGFIALVVALTELLIIWGGAGLGLSLPHWNWHWLGNVMLYTYLIAGLGSLVLAVVGLVMDAHRMLAFLALVLAVVNIAICVIPLAV